MTFAALRAELDHWSAAGRPATLWWRDDDAGAATPALARMLAIAQARDVPLAIAAIPSRLSDDAILAIAASSHVDVLQHGIEHRNHARPDERSCELGVHRPLATTAAELSQGRQRLESAFGPRFVPVLVPPWNRIAPEVTAMLPVLGYRGLSTFSSRKQRHAAPGVTQCNTHVDPIAWREGRVFVGDDASSARLAAHLRARREGQADADEPTGLLTHHADFDAAAWAFVDRLFDETRSHPAATWIRAADAFPPGDDATSGRSA